MDRSRSSCTKFSEISLFFKNFENVSIVIYIFIADSFVNEIFGDNMITPTHNDVHPPFRPLFTRNFLVMVDEYTGISEINEHCTARSPLAGDTMIRWCNRCTVLFRHQGN